MRNGKLSIDVVLCFLNEIEDEEDNNNNYRSENTKMIFFNVVIFYTNKWRH